ncbi:bifunctional diguanylate cyclase/phosphodiesterase [Marinomonas ostreistagni]|uniref:bifunctional diguanylate cyclase/phosphodiesterase n=1 Tax=Marinomonas ostreistagni TaxID=359209 RepID=UPI0019516D27|nr:bifunctional diguanylate cyclase/phosphodiesterase [Marinomonas ostreistagni]MBM6550391.1 EAL domain-containing protein [Marinomonas ostreistagni]
MFLNLLRHFFLIDDAEHESADAEPFRTSALRIMLAIALLAFSAFALHSLFFIGRSESHLLISLISSSYVILCGVLLLLSQYYLKWVAAAFCGVLAVTGVGLLCLSDNTNGYYFALLALYSIPLIIRIFYSFKASMIASGANVGALALGLHDTGTLSQYLTDPSQITSLHYHFAAFALLNVALPLAFSRVLNTLHITIARLKSLAEQLNHHSALYEEIFEHTGTPTLLCDRKGQILKLNQHARELFPEDARQRIEGTRINDWVHSTSDTNNRFFWQKNASECVFKDNASSFLEVHRSALTTHGYYVLHLQDVTHLRALTEELETTQQTNSRLAHFDSLTRLPNHQNFCKLVNRQLREASEYYTGAMFIIRISQFKLLNKQYGREQSNRVILNFAKTLQARLSDQTITSRLRGVKFACFMPIGQTHLIQRNLRLLIKNVLPDQIRIGQDLLNIDYQIGISYYQNANETAEELLEHCEMALEYSTSAERIAFFDQQLESKLIQEHKLGLALGEAVKNKDIQLWLQPQVIGGGEIRSFEALARWQLKDGAYVSPIVFIKLAEELGLLPKLAEGLIRQLVDVLAEWHKEQIRTPIAFNLAGQELMNDAFFALLMSMTSEHPWLSDMLELEITETSAVMTHPLIHKRLRTLSQYGYSIAIDDFGTGQASLGQLIDIPANILKIDRRFVAPLPDDSRHLDIVKSTIQLAKSLNMNVIAEGIETREQANLLFGLGCDTLQGYYFGKPCPITEWTANSHEKAKQLRMVY